MILLKRLYNQKLCSYLLFFYATKEELLSELFPAREQNETALGSTKTTLSGLGKGFHYYFWVKGFYMYKLILVLQFFLHPVSGLLYRLFLKKLCDPDSIWGASGVFRMQLGRLLSTLKNLIATLKNWSIILTWRRQPNLNQK